WPPPRPRRCRRRVRRPPRELARRNCLWLVLRPLSRSLRSLVAPSTPPFATSGTGRVTVGGYARSGPVALAGRGGKEPVHGGEHHRDPGDPRARPGHPADVTRGPRRGPGDAARPGGGLGGDGCRCASRTAGRTGRRRPRG